MSNVVAVARCGLNETSLTDQTRLMRKVSDFVVSDLNSFKLGLFNVVHVRVKKCDSNELKCAALATLPQWIFSDCE